MVSNQRPLGIGYGDRCASKLYSGPTADETSPPIQAIWLSVGEEIDKLLKKGVIERTCPTPGQVVSNVLLRPKPNGQHRLILDLMDLNKSIEYEHFKMTFDIMRKDCWMASVDLKDAYYSVPVAQEERKFRRFLWEGQMFQSVALPNGLASVPRIFTKILTPVYAKLRESGHECFPYIDDSFVIADTVKQCQETVKILCEQLDKLGFVIHTERSVIRLTQNLIFFGFHLDSREMKVCPTKKKRQKLRRAVNNLRNKEVNSIRKVAGLVGLMLSYSPAVQYGRAHVKEVELQKNAALKQKEIWAENEGIRQGPY